MNMSKVERGIYEWTLQSTCNSASILIEDTADHLQLYSDIIRMRYMSFLQIDTFFTG